MLLPETYKVFKGIHGLSTAKISNKVALRASVTGSIFLDNVRVGNETLLPQSKGLASAFGCLNSARYVCLHSNAN
jgi:glutaryl-CoA dehydrogenase